jgi:hypothetical protein
MKTTIASGVLGLGALLLAVACGADEQEETALSSSHRSSLVLSPPTTETRPSAEATLVSPPHSSYEPVKVSDPMTIETNARERTAFDDKIAAQGEAVSQPMPPELEARLEAQYQAAIQRSDYENGLAVANKYSPVDFEALFEKIRTTMPPGRGILLMQYVDAANRVRDLAERTVLLRRLASPELDNVR